MGRETAIRGRVRRQEEPVEGAYLTLKGASGEFVGEVRSDALGRFQLFAAPGEWTITCLVPGAIDRSEALTLRSGDEKEIDFEV